LGDNDDDLAWSPDGKRLAFFEDSGGLLRVLDRRTGEVLVQRRFGQGYSVQYDESGARLLVDADDGARLLDAETLESLTGPTGVPGRRVERIALAPDARSAVVVTANDLGSEFDFFGAARHWAHLDLETGEVLREGTLTASAGSAAVSPDGTRLAVASAAGLERVDLATGEARRAVNLSAGHESEGQLATWSGVGELVASSDGSGRVSLWDGRTSALLGTIQPGETASSPVFLDDDRTLLIGVWDGSVYEWDTSVEHAVETACSIVGRGLTEAEWRLAFGDRPYVETC
jgi:WD40 repeat protein